MNQGTQEQREEALTAREIFNKILKGQVVRLPNDPQLAEQLRNHLNVIKSRDKKLFKSLGLDFTSSVIKIEFIEDKSEHGKLMPVKVGHLNELLPTYPVIPKGWYQISLSAPKARRRYPVFSIQEEDDVSPSPI